MYIFRFLLITSNKAFLNEKYQQYSLYKFLKFINRDSHMSGVDGWISLPAAAFLMLII